MVVTLADKLAHLTVVWLVAWMVSKRVGCLVH